VQQKDHMNRNITILSILILTFATACKTNFRITVMTPPAVLLHEHTTRILVVNNVTHDNSPDKLLTQALQGQQYNGNVMASERAVLGIIRSFDDSRYLKGIPANPIILRKGNEINWSRVDSLCEALGAHAIIEIENFETLAPVGGTILANASGQRTSPLRGWAYSNVYIAGTREHIDRLEVGEVYHMPVSGILDPLTMLNDMMRKRELYGHLGQSVGYRTGMMFYSNWVWVGRTYYNKGSRNLRRAKRSIRFGNWNVAERILLQDINSRSNKVAGRAKYNLALVYEGQGRLDEAIQMAERAAFENGTRLAFSYITVLRRRLEAQPRIVLLQD
jgi:tetratricopeptide (TPR) repeat protein